MMFRDVLACGHHVNNDSAVQITVQDRRAERVGRTSRCYTCPPFSGAAAMSVIEDVWVRIAPGSYVDVEAVLHLDALEVCEFAGVDPTPENQERLSEVARTEFADDPHGVNVETVEDAPLALERRDCVVAIADLCSRTGARNFVIGYLRDPDEPEFASKGPGWYCQVTIRASRIICDEMPMPEHAADGLAHRILDGGTCTHCGETTTSADTPTGVYLRWGASRKARCKWWRDGPVWRRGCEVVE